MSIVFPEYVVIDCLFYELITIEIVETTIQYGCDHYEYQY